MTEQSQIGGIAGNFILMVEFYGEGGVMYEKSILLVSRLNGSGEEIVDAGYADNDVQPREGQ